MRGRSDGEREGRVVGKEGEGGARAAAGAKQTRDGVHVRRQKRTHDVEGLEEEVARTRGARVLDLEGSEGGASEGDGSQESGRESRQATRFGARDPRHALAQDAHEGLDVGSRDQEEGVKGGCG